MVDGWITWRAEDVVMHRAPTNNVQTVDMGMGVVGELTQLAGLLGILQTGKVFEINKDLQDSVIQEDIRRGNWQLMILKKDEYKKAILSAFHQGVHAIKF